MADSIGDVIRQSQEIAMQKLASVKLALDERRLQLLQLVVNDARPRTAFLRTPAHIRALYESVCQTAIELRAQLNETTTSGGRSRTAKSSSNERSQSLALVTDLERELDLISRRLELVYQRRKSPPTLPPSSPPPPSTTVTNCADADATSPPLRLPPLNATRSPAAELSGGRRRTTRAMMLRLQAAAMQRQSADTEGTRDYQCYPRGSSFPKLSPVVPRRRTSRFVAASRPLTEHNNVNDDECDTAALRPLQTSMTTRHRLMTSSLSNAAATPVPVQRHVRSVDESSLEAASMIRSRRPYNNWLRYQFE